MEKRFTLHILTDIWDDFEGECYEEYYSFSTAEEAVEKAERLAEEYAGHVIALEVYEDLKGSEIRNIWDFEDGWYGLDD